MTQYRNDPDKITNFFDRLLSNIGHRGSSFMDVDCLVVTQDDATHRFLFQEMKEHGERPISIGQRKTLIDLASEERHVVWFVRRRQDGYIDFIDITREIETGQTPFSVVEIIDTGEYARRFKCWWACRDYAAMEQRGREQIARQAISD